MKERKLDGALMFMFVLALVLLTAVTVMQQLEIKELAEQQLVIFVVIDEKLNPIEAKTDIIVDAANKLIGYETRVVYGVGSGN